MTTFDERERAFEEKFRHDQELRFKVHARRNRLIGEWAAAKMGLGRAEADRYAVTLVDTDVQRFHDDEIVARLLKDMKAKGVRVTEPQVRREMERQLVAAKQQVWKQT